MNEACPFCGAEASLDTNGDCSMCRRNVIAVEKDADEELQFYCEVCDDFFESRRDETGYDQARCPKCGELCLTPNFHAGDMARSDRSATVGLAWLIWLLLSVLASGLGWMILSQN
jgi:uncharacterized paraquat-inducible protein A